MAGSSYGLFQISAEELVENPLEESIEKKDVKKLEYFAPTFKLKHPERVELGIFHVSKYSLILSAYEQQIHVPPPNFLHFS